MMGEVHSRGRGPPGDVGSQVAGIEGRGYCGCGRLSPGYRVDRALQPTSPAALVMFSVPADGSDLDQGIYGDPYRAPSLQPKRWKQWAMECLLVLSHNKRSSVVLAKDWALLL